MTLDEIKAELRATAPRLTDTELLELAALALHLGQRRNADRRLRAAMEESCKD